MPFRLTPTTAMFALAATLPIAAHAAGQASIVAKVDYARPHQLVEIGNGRKLNLFCAGSGSPTVVFDAAMGAAGWDWLLVHPVVAQKTRACVYDRAGYGFSDAPNHKSTSADQVADLHALLSAASIAPPYVLVGHSLGGRNAQLYAYTYPQEVAGLVIVDSEHEDGKTRGDRVTGGKYSMAVAGQRGQLEVCDKAGHAGLKKGTIAYKQCIDPADDKLYGKSLASAVHATQTKPAYWDTLMAEYDNFSAASADQLRGARKGFGNLPLVYLTRSISPFAVPGRPQSPENKAFEDDVKASHDEIARLSSRGINRVVPGTGHDIPIQKPQAVIDAVLEVLGAHSGK